MSADARARAVAGLLGDRALRWLVVSDLVNVRYLTGFAGSNGLAVLGAEGERVFVTDFRYVTQARDELEGGYEVVVAEGELAVAAAAALDGAGQVGFDDVHTSVKEHARLAELIGDAGRLEPAGGLIEGLRAVKDGGEVGRIRAAAELVDGLYEWLAERGVAGRTERALCVELEHEMRMRGASGPSFPSIVAAGARSALPHAAPGAGVIEEGMLLTVDMGARLDGYCSDCTRTFAVGRVGREEREVYELVLAAQEAGLVAVVAGVAGRDVDAVARAVIDEAGHGEHFGHGLGHGVGLEIHEAPRLGRIASEARLEAGNVVTIEPGVYVPDRFGVRIEDLVVVGPEGPEVLSRFPKELISLR